MSRMKNLFIGGVICTVIYCIMIIHLFTNQTPDKKQSNIQDPVDPLDLLKDVRDLRSLIPKDNSPFLAQPAIIPTQSHSGVTILVFVQSRPSHRQKRHLIRSTWADIKQYKTDENFHTIFVMGKNEKPYMPEVTDEILDYKDILLLDMIDHYDHLTVKGYLTMTWIAERVPWVTHILKTDDDVILDMFAWMNIAKKVPLSCAIFGMVWENPMVLREGKYTVTREEYPYITYPSFCSGAAYMMTMDTMLTILEASHYIPFLVRDDPYFTGIVAQASGVELVTAPEHAFYYSLGVSELDVSKRKNGIIMLHGYRTNKWKQFWKERLHLRTHISLRGHKRHDIMKVCHKGKSTMGFPVARLASSQYMVNVTIEHQCNQTSQYDRYSAITIS